MLRIEVAYNKHYIIKCIFALYWALDFLVGGNICKFNAQGGIAFQKLYTFDIGRNDLAKGFFFGNMTIEEVNASILDILNKFSINVKVNLYLY